MVRFLAIALTLIAACSGNEPAYCKNSLGTKRTQDLHHLANSGNPEKVVVLTIDTSPTKRSELLESTLKYFDYEYYILGNQNAKQQPHPKKSGVFREYFFSYKLYRYLDTLQEIMTIRGPKSIVVLTDASDVMFALGPKAIKDRFEKLGQPIILSGEMLITATRLPYIKRFAQELHMEEELESTNSDTIKLVELLREVVIFKGTSWGYGDLPFVLWMPEVQETVSLIKKIPVEPNGPANQFRYVNSGGIVGYADALIEALEDMDIQIGDDDQAIWNQWYGAIGYPRNKGLIDYQQTTLAQINHDFDMDAVFRFLFDDFPTLPSKPPFVFKWEPDTMPVAYHCAGCNQSNMRSFHRQIVNTLQERFEIFSKEQLQFVNGCY
ncbi:MAG: hypothetical protein JKY15_06175 [Deltaproteobacteria bacterium]|nr:hypothetical protein [Deltaproteobacteria bacterium]